MRGPKGDTGPAGPTGLPGTFRYSLAVNETVHSVKLCK
jgi:hypothetical protein